MVLKSAGAPQLAALAHTVNWRRLPSAGGAAAGRRRGAARRGREAAGAAGAAPSVAARSANGEDRPNVGAADCGTSRYSAESTADALAGNATHPPSVAGSIDAYAPIASVS